MISRRIFLAASAAILLLSACAGRGESTAAPIIGGALPSREDLSIEDMNPGAAVTRSYMAVFLLKAKYGEEYRPLPPAGGFFTDIAGHWAESWIEQLAVEGISSGYSDGSFQPENTVARAEAAVFLLKAKHGPGYFPPPASEAVFADVSGHWAADWIEQLKSEGISSGFSDGTFRPDAPLSAADLKTLLEITFP